jgi:polysaccharide pyruvyl transferase CsaB
VIPPDTALQPPRRVLIAGSYGQGNTGDEAILAALLAGLRAGRPDLHVQVVSGHVAATVAQHAQPSPKHFAALHWGDWPAIAAALAAADLLILGGGGIFFDYWGFDPGRLLENEAPDLAHYASFPLLAALLGKPLFLCAVGVGPLFTAAGRGAVRLAFALAARASVRDEESKQLLVEIGVPAERVEVTADPAFALAVAGDPAARLAALGLGARPLLGVTPRPWDVAVSQDAWETALAGSLAAFARAIGAQILLIPFHAGYDDAALERLAAKLLAAGLAAEDVRSLAADRPPAEIAAVIGRCDLLVGLRLHSLLFALLTGTPAVALAYDPKVRSLARLAGHEELCLELADLSTLGAVLADAWARREELRRDFLAASARLKPAAERNAELALELLAGGAPAPVVLGPPDQEAFRRLAGAALAGRLRDLAARDAMIRERGGVIERQWTEMEQYRTWLAQANAATAVATAAVIPEPDDGTLRRLRAQRDLLLAERNDLDRRLTALEQTLAYRIVSRFWRLLRQVFPEGSRRRKLYRLGRRAAGKLLGARDPAGPAVWTAGAGGAAAGESPEGAPDFRAELLRFEERVRAGGAPPFQRVVAIFSGTQLVESEGQRPTQLALALARRGIPVVFVYWRWWDHEWRPQDRLQEGIVQIPVDVVTRRPEMLTGAFAGAERIALFEFPHPAFFATLSAANSAGWLTVYDMLDDWEEFHRVGQAIWWDEEFERHLAGACDAVFGINEVLAGRLRDLGGGAADKAEVVGNGLKPGLGTVGAPRPLARGEVTVGYFGYLSGAWFDWDLILEAARRRPTWRFYLIGYGGTPEGSALPSNIELLGKQPQADLAAFAAHWDVAVVPFKPDRLAAGADPIKTYEYLAMGLPVVVTGVHPPPGGEAFVRRAEGIDEFLRAIEEAVGRGGVEKEAARSAFAASCSWDHRLAALLGSLAEGRQRVAEKRALFAAVPEAADPAEPAP